MRRNVWILLLVGALIGVLIGGCGQKVAVKCTDPEDNPEHHYLRGMEALEKAKIDIAEEKFNRAIYCDDKYSPAYSGLAIAGAEKTKAEKDPGFKKVESERTFGHLKKAKDLMKTEENKFDYQIAVMRVYTALKPQDWLSTVESAFKDARGLKVDEKKLTYYQGTESALYFMGEAYLSALEFQKARDSFASVLSAKREGKWHERADKGWKKTDKIVRAMAGITVGDVGKKIAIKDSITRGDLSALLIDELTIDKLFAGRIPVESQIAELQAEFTPADILNHHFKEEILTIMKWKVRGLEPIYDDVTKANLFKPEEPVLRKDMALTLEDVLIKLTGDEKIATAYFGQDNSPFPDVKPTAPWFNAVMNMTTRSIMEGELSGEFRVDAPVDGAEALLAIRVLRQKMNIY